MPKPTHADQVQWRRDGKLKPGEELLALYDVETGKPVTTHAGSAAYNTFRNRFIMIAEESGGTSYLGEIWYAEANSPLGPWVYARKIVTHEKYSFYNPKHHVMFDQEAGRRIFFEGTYSTFFSGVEQPTPRYDYNQIMYSLELNDPRLNLPVPVYESRKASGPPLALDGTGTPICMACDRLTKGLVAVGEAASLPGRLVLGANPAAFYAWPADDSDAPATTVNLFEWENTDDGQYQYAIEGETAPAGFRRAEKPLCRVWRYPLLFDLPRE